MSTNLRHMALDQQFPLDTYAHQDTNIHEVWTHWLWTLVDRNTQAHRAQLQKSYCSLCSKILECNQDSHLQSERPCCYGMCLEGIQLEHGFPVGRSVLLDMGHSWGTLVLRWG